MSRLILRTAGVALVLLWTNGAAPAHGDAIVDSWELVVSVYDFKHNQDNTDSFTIVKSPLDPNSHSVGLGQSTAQSSYDFAWGAEFGRFLIQASQEAHAVGAIMYSFCNGEIRFRPGVDSAFTVTPLFNYDLPAMDMTAFLSVMLQDTSAAPPTTIFADSGFEETTNFAPKSGTFGTPGSGTLLAGHQYTLTYQMRTSASGSSGQFASGSGQVDLTFDPLPEPASMALFALGLLAVLPRRHYN